MWYVNQSSWLKAMYTSTHYDLFNNNSSKSQNLALDIYARTNINFTFWGLAQDIFLPVQTIGQHFLLS